MMSPLFGPIRKLMLLNYDASAPALFTVLPELVDVHRRAGLDSPLQYHLGGFGFCLEEAIMKALGETVERSSQVTFPSSSRHLLKRHSHDELASLGIRHLPIHELGRFSDEQMTGEGFFRKIPKDHPIWWVPGIDLRNDQDTLVPLQAVIVGFTSRDELRSTLAVTTGTAAHTGYGKALSGAVRELLQIDATVGHWYSNSKAPRIEMSSSSTPRLARLFERYRDWLSRSGVQIEFYWLKQPEELPIFVVACAVRRPGGYPSLSFGLGADADLEAAMYSALCEAIPVSVIALINAVEQLYGPQKDNGAMPQRLHADLQTAYSRLDLKKLMNFDHAVGYWALPENAAKLFPARFDSDAVLGGPDIRRQVASLPAGNGDAGIELIRATLEHHRLFMFDLTAPDTEALGFKVVRLFSPDLLALCAPSYPEAAHPRFAAFGGFRSFDPHPYP
ncbi:MAG TPA: YcaO-like family protein [Bryobacteraceae bacterium]